MAAADVAVPSSIHNFGPITKLPTTTTTTLSKHDVETELNFFKPNEDGSPPAPTYVTRPETYERPSDSQNVTVHDVSGRRGQVHPRQPWI